MPGPFPSGDPLVLGWYFERTEFVGLMHSVSE